jgi:hypothetical protein
MLRYLLKRKMAVPLGSYETGAGQPGKSPIISVVTFSNIAADVAYTGSLSDVYKYSTLPLLNSLPVTDPTSISRYMVLHVLLQPCTSFVPQNQCRFPLSLNFSYSPQQCS